MQSIKDIKRALELEGLKPGTEAYEAGFTKRRITLCQEYQQIESCGECRTNDRCSLLQDTLKSNNDRKQKTLEAHRAQQQQPGALQSHFHRQVPINQSRTYGAATNPNPNPQRLRERKDEPIRKHPGQVPTLPISSNRGRNDSPGFSSQARKSERGHLHEGSHAPKHSSSSAESGSIWDRCRWLGGSVPSGPRPHTVAGINAVSRNVGPLIYKPRDKK